MTQNIHCRSSTTAFLTTANKFLEAYMGKWDCSGKTSLEPSTASHGLSQAASNSKSLELVNTAEWAEYKFIYFYMEL